MGVGRVDFARFKDNRFSRRKVPVKKYFYSSTLGFDGDAEILGRKSSFVYVSFFANQLTFCSIAPSGHDSSQLKQFMHRE